VVDAFLSGLVARGLSGDQAVGVYKVFTGFLLGNLLLHVAEAGAATAPVDEPLDEGSAPVPNLDQQLSLDDYPTLCELAPGLRTHDPDGDFESALESLLDRLDGELSQ
jgi:TetR/AcrR family tetracycline transcriptional repressor